MTQQDAYAKICAIVNQINALITEAKNLASDHEVEFECSNFYSEVYDPDEDWNSSDYSWYDSGCVM